MEVHSHTHTARKKWTHYFWEFLMLFLAVFCGFIAENFREHNVEKQRGKQYIRSFYEDLKTDTATLSAVIDADNIKLTALGGIFKCYDTLRENWQFTSCLIPIEKNTRSNFTVVFSIGTLQQLKNAGGYRLLDEEDRDSVMAYDSRIQNYKDYESTIFQESQDNVRNTFGELVDFNARKFLQPAIAGPDSSHTGIPLLFTDNKTLLNKYFNDLFRYKIVTEGQKRNMIQIRGKAIVLINYFKQKHHLE